MALSPLSNLREEGAGERGLLLAPIDETGGDKEPLYRYVRTWTKSGRHRAGRLAVCGSDAREVGLHLLACLKVDDHGVIKMPFKRVCWGLPGRLRGCGEVPAPAQQEVRQQQSVSPPGDHSEVAANLRRPCRAGCDPRGSRWNEKEGKEKPRSSFRGWEKRRGHMGTVVHAWLHRHRPTMN